MMMPQAGFFPVDGMGRPLFAGRPTHRGRTISNPEMLLNMNPEVLMGMGPPSPVASAAHGPAAGFMFSNDGAEHRGSTKKAQTSTKKAPSAGTEADSSGATEGNGEGDSAGSVSASAVKSKREGKNAGSPLKRVSRDFFFLSRCELPHFVSHSDVAVPHAESQARSDIG
eukprot:SAG31_NODE_4796_length_2952_cov_12.871714_3_plen_169_part_00